MKMQTHSPPTGSFNEENLLSTSAKTAPCGTGLGTYILIGLLGGAPPVAALN